MGLSPVLRGALSRAWPGQMCRDTTECTWGDTQREGKHGEIQSLAAWEMSAKSLPEERGRRSALREIQER